MYIWSTVYLYDKIEFGINRGNGLNICWNFTNWDLTLCWRDEIFPIENLFKRSDITNFHSMKKPQLLPQEYVIVLCYRVSYWFRTALRLSQPIRVLFISTLGLEAIEKPQLSPSKKQVRIQNCSFKWMCKITNSLYNIRSTWGLSK